MSNEMRKCRGGDCINGKYEKGRRGERVEPRYQKAPRGLIGH
jgi:hypothetical protein